MKTKNLFLAVACCSAMGSKAQLSLGVDAALPMGDFGDVYSLGIGPTAGLDISLTEVFAVFGQVSYDFMMVKSDYSDVLSNAYMIPYQAGLKLYVSGDSRGLYGMALLGGHTAGVKTTIGSQEESSSTSLFSWGLGGGFRMNQIDIGVRYNSISPDKEIDEAKASNYIGLRVGFMLGGE